MNGETALDRASTSCDIDIEILMYLTEISA